jgi:Peptidase inhibitor family I36
MKFSRFLLSTVAASAAAFTLAVAPASAAPGGTSADSAALTQHLTAKGGKLSADGSWMSMPNGVDVSMTPMAFRDCPVGWVCLWKDGGFRGRMLKWSTPGTRIAHLSDYGFNDEMSSWANRGSRLARWWTDANYKGSHHNMPAGSSSAHGGGDTASSFKIY